MKLIGNGVWGCMHVCFLSCFLPGCLCVCVCVILFFVFDFAFLYLLVDVYRILMLNRKMVWSPTWLFVGKTYPGMFGHVFVAFNTGSFEKDIVFGRAWPLHLGESISAAGENKAFAAVLVELVSIFQRFSLRCTFHHAERHAVVPFLVLPVGQELGF